MFDIYYGTKCNLACRHCDTRSDIIRTTETDPDIDIILEGVRNANGVWSGYNFAVGSYCDMGLEGIIDPVKVTRCALQNAVSAASILLMAELNKLKTISRKKLASQFSISEVTISKTFKEILPYKNILINDDITDKIVIKINNDMKKEEVPLEVLERMKKLGITTNNNIITKQEVTDEYNFDDIIEDDDFTENYEEISEYCKEKIANAKYILNKLKSSTLEEEIILMRESYLLLSMLNNDLKQFYNDIN
jgi:hypothetical protein